MPSKRNRVVVALVFAIAGAAVAPGARAGTVGDLVQERGAQGLSPQAIQAGIDSLGNLDFSIRMNSSRALRRAPAAAVAPALIRAVESHMDQFVRFRALVL